MADTYTKIADLIDPEVMGDMVSARIPKKLRVAPFAKVDDTLAGVPGDTITVPAYAYIGDADIVAEGEAVTIEKMTTSTRKATVKKAMKGIGLTDEAVLSGYGNPVGEANTQLAMAIAAKIDNDCMDVLQTATLTYDGSAGIISYAGVVDAGNVLDDGKSKPGAAGGLAAALVHPVEALEHPVHIRLGDADARVCHRQGGAVGGAGHGDGDPAVLLVVLHGVVHQVEDHLVHNAFHAVDFRLVANHRDDHAVFLGGGLQAAGHIPGQGGEVEVLPLQLDVRLIQAGEVQNVIHQGDQPLGFLVDVPGKAGDVLGLDNAVFDNLRKAGDGGQRRFQLMRDIGRKFPAHMLCIVCLLYTSDAADE